LEPATKVHAITHYDKKKGTDMKHIKDMLIFTAPFFVKARENHETYQRKNKELHMSDNYNVIVTFSCPHIAQTVSNDLKQKLGVQCDVDDVILDDALLVGGNLRIPVVNICNTFCHLEDKDKADDQTCFEIYYYHNVNERTT